MATPRVKVKKVPQYRRGSNPVAHNNSVLGKAQRAGDKELLTMIRSRRAEYVKEQKAMEDWGKSGCISGFERRPSDRGFGER